VNDTTMQSDPVRWLFIGESGLRSAYRVALWFAIVIPCTIAAAVIGELLQPVFSSVGIRRGEAFLMVGTITYTPAILLTLVFGAFDKPRVTSAGLGGPVLRSLAEYTSGTAMGVGLVLLTLLAPATVGSVRMDALAPSWHWAMIPLWFVGLAIAAAWEEVLFRGYGFQWICRATGNVIVYAVRPLFPLEPDVVAQWLGRAFWIALSSGVFAIMHAANPNAGILSGINTGLAGIWLAVAVFRTRALWLACGLHLGWNFAQGPLLGLPISGLGSAESGMSIPSLWSTALTGPNWATGGSYGIEAGLPCTVVLFIAIALAALYKPRPLGQDAPVLRPGRIHANQAAE
jgi:membrane protease YdiL (CAAX protease family)